MLRATRLKTSYLTNPVGIDTEYPELRWNMEGTSQKQSAYEIRAARTLSEMNSGKFTWESDVVKSSQMLHHPYEQELANRERIYWQVRIIDENCIAGPWSEAAFFETGLLNKSDWNAGWITGDYTPEKRICDSADYFFKTFECEKVRKARLYISAVGLYEVKLNGSKVGNQQLTPGFTSYDKRVQYQTFDVTELLTEDKNTIEIALGNGWFRG